MDVNARLHQIREIISTTQAAKDLLGEEGAGPMERRLFALVAAVDDLDAHMTAHGCAYAPDAWKETEDHR